MKTIKLISGQFCSRCHMLAPKLKQWAEDNGYNFVEIDVNNASPEEIEWATMLPVVWRNWEQLDFDATLAKIS